MREESKMRRCETYSVEMVPLMFQT
jgi:hypothetical protein